MLDGANTSALVLAQAVDSFSRSEQRWEFANTAADVAVLSVALAAIVLFCFRPRTRDLTLIYFSLFCILYAVRLFAYLPSFRSLFDWSPKFWSYVAWVISSVLIFSRRPVLLPSRWQEEFNTQRGGGATKRIGQV